MNTWGQRLEMAQRGWRTQVGIDHGGRDDGTVRVGTWVRRGYWAGDRIDITFHDVAEKVLFSDEDILTVLRQQLDAVCGATIRAERDFARVVPCQIPDKLDDCSLNLVINSRATEHELRAPRDDYVPTERLPDDLDGWFKSDSDDALEHLVGAALRGLNVRDSIDAGFSALPRMPYDCQNRDWGYRLHLGKVEHLGEPLARQNEQVTSKNLNEAIVSGVILGTADGIDHLFELYPDSMPPGFMTRAEKLAEQDSILPQF